MNAATKTKWSTLITWAVTFLLALQSSFTVPPFSAPMVFTVTGAITILITVLTAWKQYISPEINDKAIKVTAITLLIAITTGAMDMLHLISINDVWAKWIKLVLSALIVTLNIASKQWFPSELQKDRQFDLKKIKE